MLAGLLLCGHVLLGSQSFPEPPAGTLELTSEEEAFGLALGHFAMGFLHGFAPDPDSAKQAERHFRAALRLAPQSSLVAEALVFPFLMNRDFMGAVQALRPFLADHPSEPHLVLLTAEALELAGETDQSVASLEAGLRAGGWTSGRIFRQLFTRLWQQGRQQEAERLLRQAGRRRRLRTTFDYHYTAALHANFTLAKAMAQDLPGWRRKRWETATIDHAREAAECAGPDADPADIGEILDLLIAAEEWSAARNLAERLADRHDWPELRLRKAELLLRDGETARGIGYLAEQIVRHLPEDWFPEATQILVDAGQPEAAVRIFERYLLVEPDSLAARFQLAWLHDALDQPEAGIAALLPLHNPPPEVLLLLAHLHANLGEDNLALLGAERARATAAEHNLDGFPDADFHLFVAFLHERNGNTAAAIQAARHALASEPQSPACANFLGYLLADANRELDTAERLIRSAVAAEPENAAYLDSLAWALYRQGHFEPALAAILRALELADEPDPVILDHAGDICAALRLHTLARLYWARALAEQPTNPAEIRRKRMELDLVDSLAFRR